jgi:hemolysin III
MYHGERFNSITHLIALAVSIAAVSVMITLSALTKDPWKISSCVVFGLSTVFLYAFSTLYHSFQGRVKNFFRSLDYVAIYLMIAGTYTPFTLVSLRGSVGWWVFAGVWTLAAIGIGQELLRRASPKRKLSLFIYLVMGWLIIGAVGPLLQSLTRLELLFLFLGGAFYSIGILFFINDDKWKHAHGIWHLFVMAGTTCHFISVISVVA